MTVHSAPDAGRRPGSFRSIDSVRAAQLRGALVAALALTVASSVLAEPFGQGLVQELEPNGTSATATPLGGTNVVAEGQIVASTESDFWSFTASAGHRVHAAVVTSGSAQSLNSQLDLIASDGTTVIENDTDDGSFGAVSSSIAGTPIASGGTYYLRVRYQSPGSSSEIRPYRLYLRVQSGSPAEEEEPNDLVAQALPTAGWVAGNLDAGEKDLYSIALAAGDTLFASLDADPERDGGTTYNPELGIVLPSVPGDPIVVDDGNTTSPNSEAIFATVKSAGTYLLQVTESSGAGGAAYTYRLSVSVLPATAQGLACTTYSSTDVPEEIATGPGQTVSTLTIPGNPRIADLDLSLQLSHARPEDLDLHLISPAGNDNAVLTDVGAALFPDWDLTLDDESAVPAGSYPLAILDGLGLQPAGVEPVRQYRLDWFDGEDAGGDWTLVIDDDTAANGGTLDGWSLRICEPAALPACPEGTTRETLFVTDFEGGEDGFTHAGTQDEWELGLPSGAPIDDCASGSSCWDTDLGGAYDNSSDQELVSPAVDLAGTVGPIVVSWAQKYQLENATWDKFTVDLSLAGGGAPQTLFDWRGPDMVATVGTTTLQPSAGWGIVRRIADGSFDGQSVELRFRLVSDGSNAYDGVAIDDVEITACLLPPTDIFADGFLSGNVCAWSDFVGSNDDCQPEP